MVMTNTSRSHDEGVLKALSNSTRRAIIRLISKKGSASYTEIMQVLGLDPSLESGTFNYHLKELAEASLIENVNGEYKISALGRNALILIDQVREEPQVDRYGVLSAALSMTPREELELFKMQIGSGFGSIITLFSFIIMLFTFGQLGFVVAFVSFVLSLILTISSTIKLIQNAKKYALGLSVLLFISESWFLLRSPNRGNFMAFGGFSMISICFMALYFLSVAAGAGWISAVGVAMVMISVFTAPFALILADTAIKKVEELESMEGE
ncbi:MAG: winged helix-turn-helix domain-containing protein [Candidatus Thorarchaeota archaeon]